MNGTAVKWSLNSTQNCGDTCPVRGLRTSATDPACDGEWPTYILRRDRGSYLGAPPTPDWRWKSKTKQGNPKVWSIEGSMKSLSTLKKVASQLQPSDWSESWFSQYAASLSANGNISVVMLSGQWHLAWRSNDWEIKVSSFIFLLMIPFWSWATTAQYVTSWLQSFTACWKSESADCPLSAW